MENLELSNRQKIYYTRDTMEGLESYQKVGIVCNGDIKSDNIGLKDGNAVLFDHDGCLP